MSLPGTITPVTVTCKYLLPSGAPARGSVSFSPSIAAATDGVTLPISPLAVTLDDQGAISVILAATDDPDWLAAGFTYEVVERIAGAAKRVYDIVVPAATPGGALDLATASPVAPVTAVTPYVKAAGDTMAGPLVLEDGSPAASEQYVADHAAGGAVTSVNGHAGVVVLAAGDVGADASGVATAAVAAHAAASDPHGDRAYAAGQAAAAQTAAEAYTDTAIGAVDLALDDKADLVGGKLDQAQLPDIAIVQYLGQSASQAAMLALAGQSGDWTIRTDLGTVWVITGADPTQLANWTQLGYPVAPVTSVAGRTGAVSLAKADVGLGNVDNTADASKAFDGSQITAGTVAFARLPTGATSTTVAVGNDSRLSDSRAPNGAAGGDLTGTYPNPTLGAAILAAVRARSSHTGTQLAATVSDFNSAASAAAPVQSVAGKTGAVVLAAADIPSLDAAKITTGVFGPLRIPVAHCINQLSGAWYSCPDAGSSTTITALTDQQAFLLPLDILTSATLAGLLVEITTQDAAGVIRFGLASCDANGKPSAWLADYGTAVATAIALIQPGSTPATALTAGTRYFLGIVPQGITSGLAMRSKATNDPRIPLTQSSAPASLNATRNAWLSTGWSGALSGAITVSATTGSGPHIAVKLT